MKRKNIKEPFLLQIADGIGGGGAALNSPHLSALEAYFYGDSPVRGNAYILNTHHPSLQTPYYKSSPIPRTKSTYLTLNSPPY